MIIAAIDPGTLQSGWCVFNGVRVIDCGIADNQIVLTMISDNAWGDDWHASTLVAIEMIASYGMPVGREVFETCLWIGRYQQAYYTKAGVLPKLVYRKDVKLHLCQSPRAKDPHIRQALIDRLGPVGTKKQPGACFGVSSHMWAALGVAVTALDANTSIL